MYEAYGYALIPIIIALVQLAKAIGMPARYAPLFSIVLGMAAGYLYLFPDEPKRAILEGIVMGLIAVGLWSGVKNTFGKS